MNRYILYMNKFNFISQFHNRSVGELVSLHQADALDQYFLVEYTHTLHVLMEKPCFINTQPCMCRLVVVKFAGDFCCYFYMLLDIDFCYP